MQPSQSPCFWLILKCTWNHIWVKHTWNAMPFRKIWLKFIFNFKYTSTVPFWHCNILATRDLDLAWETSVSRIYSKQYTHCHVNNQIYHRDLKNNNIHSKICDKKFFQMSNNIKVNYKRWGIEKNSHWLSENKKIISCQIENTW